MMGWQRQGSSSWEEIRYSCDVVANFPGCCTAGVPISSSKSEIIAKPPEGALRIPFDFVPLAGHGLGDELEVVSRGALGHQRLPCL